MQNTSILVIIKFNFSVESADDSECLATVSGYFDFSVDGASSIRVVNCVLFFASQPQAFCSLAFLLGERKDAHADQVGSVDALVTFCDDSFDALELRAFGGPIA